MKQSRSPLPAQGALEIIEEAVHLLRRSSATRIASYYIGSLPFILGFLYFWADMSRSAFAQRYCAGAAIGLSILFLWMKCWQAIFTQGLKDELCGEAKTGWNVRRIARLIKIQAVIQPLGLFLLPIALVVTIPFGWFYAFYQNSLPVGNDEDDLRTICKKSMRQAHMWPGQNHLLLSVFFLFGLFVFINLAFALLFIPHLVNMLLGLDTVFTRTGMHVLNTTFFTTVCGLSYLCIDPLVKTAYTLRCFYGEALTSGEDLKVGMRSLLDPRKVGAPVLFFMMLSLAGAHGMGGVAFADDSRGQGFTESTIAKGVSPTELDRSISEVLNRREYRWRMPRTVDETESHIIQSFIGGLVDWLGGIFKPIWGWVIKIFKWLKNLLPGRMSMGLETEPSMFNWMKVTRVLILFLLGIVVCALGIFLWRFWNRSKSGLHEGPEDKAIPVPNPADDEVTANQLPSTEWAAMARELMDKGELRLALRALYLSGLACLAEKDMIAIAKFKSDRDYERELRRRVHVKPDLLKAFSQNLLIFERAWYGMHKFTQQDFQACFANLERMKVCV